MQSASNIFLIKSILSLFILKKAASSLVHATILHFSSVVSFYVLGLRRRGIINRFFCLFSFFPPIVLRFYKTHFSYSLQKKKAPREAWWSIRADSIAPIPVNCSQFYQLSIPAWGCEDRGEDRRERECPEKPVARSQRL